MTITILVFSVAAISSSVGVLLGWYWRGKGMYTPSAKDLLVALESVASRDELLAAEARLRAQLHNSRRRAAPRPDAGPPSHIRRVTVTRPERWVGGKRQ